MSRFQVQQGAGSISVEEASTSNSGLMSAADKTALLALSSNAFGLVSDVILPSGPQMLFPMSKTPLSAVIFTVNGQGQSPNTDYVVFSDVVHWISTDFNISSGDTVEIIYMG